MCQELFNVKKVHYFDENKDFVKESSVISGRNRTLKHGYLI